MSQETSGGWPPPPPIEPAERRKERIEREEWWSAHRSSYNMTLLLAAPVSGLSLLGIWGLYEDRLPCLEITLLAVFPGALLFGLGLALANICYFLGPWSERLVRPRNALSFRHWVYGLGVAFSLMLVFVPPLVNLGAALFGPVPCTDKFGVRHAFNPSGYVSPTGFPK